MKNILIGLIAVMLTAACTKEPDPSGLSVDVAAGKAIAKAECAECHGMNGRGQTSEVPHLANQSFQYLVEALHAYRDGGRLHAQLQDLTSGMSEADIVNISGYYASLHPLKPVSDLPLDGGDEKSYVEGAAVAEICEDCHGDKGISTEEGVPSLAGQQPAYLIVSTTEYINGSRGHEGQEMLEGLEQVDIEKMAMYFAAHSAPLREAPDFGDPVAGEKGSESCSECHGTGGISSDPMVPNLAGQEPVYLVNAIKAYRNHDRSSDADMPEKTDRQIENLAAFYSTRQAEASVDDQLSGKEMAAKCDRCHNPTSRKRKLNVPTLKGQSFDYLVKAMKEYRREDRDNSMMHKMSARYSDEMIEALAHYYAGHSD